MFLARSTIDSVEGEVFKYFERPVKVITFIFFDKFAHFQTKCHFVSNESFNFAKRQYGQSNPDKDDNNRTSNVSNRVHLFFQPQVCFHGLFTEICKIYFFVFFIFFTFAPLDKSDDRENAAEDVDVQKQNTDHGSKSELLNVRNLG